MSWSKIDEYAPGRTLSVYLDESDEEYVEVIREFVTRDFTRVVIAGGKFPSLEILEPCSSKLKKLLLQHTDTSFVGIEKLFEMVEFKADVVSRKPFPEFGKAKNLEKCFLYWSKGYDVEPFGHGLFTLPKLSDLTLRHWTQPTCKQIAMLGLEKLDLRQGVLTTLDGLEQCSDLKVLSLAYLPKLEDIARIESLRKLEEVHVENCKNIVDLTPLTRLPNLRKLHVEKTGASFLNLDGFSNAKQLESICISAEVKDIDWTVLFNHPSLDSAIISTHDGYAVPDSAILEIAKIAKRKIIGFHRTGTKKRPSFSFSLGDR